jgi:hypothetical protein
VKRSALPEDDNIDDNIFDGPRFAAWCRAAAHALYDQIENIIADQDPPHDLGMLIERARQDGTPRGYNKHHIVEQGKQSDDLPQERIQSDENIALIPTYKHWQISAFYQMPQQELGGLTPRQFLRGKSFEERYRYGLSIMRDFRVLK